MLSCALSLCYFASNFTNGDAYNLLKLFAFLSFKSTSESHFTVMPISNNKDSLRSSLCSFLNTKRGFVLTPCVMLSLSHNHSVILGSTHNTSQISLKYYNISLWYTCQALHSPFITAQLIPSEAFFSLPLFSV